MGSVSLLQKSFLAFLVAMGVIVTLGDAYCFSKMNKPEESDKGKDREAPLTWLFCGSSALCGAARKGSKYKGEGRCQKDTKRRFQHQLSKSREIQNLPLGWVWLQHCYCCWWWVAIAIPAHGADAGVKSHSE